MRETRTNLWYESFYKVHLSPFIAELYLFPRYVFLLVESFIRVFLEIPRVTVRST